MLKYLLARYPDDTLRVHMRSFNDILLPQHDRERIPLILPQDDRERILISRNPNSADYYIYLENLPNEPLIHGIEAYGSVLGYTLAPKNVEAYRAAYDDVAANGTLLTRSDFDIYIHNGELYYLNADCESQTSRLTWRISLHIFPVDPADLPADKREQGFANRYFRLNKHASFFDGKCIVRRLLPDYPIARISMGYEGGAAEWRVDIDLAAHAAQALHAGIAAGDYGQPVARSDFDVYLRGGVLAYLKEDCDQRDVDGRFLLHVVPVDPADLPADSHERGFENRGFRLVRQAAFLGGKCIVRRTLPDYPIARIATGYYEGEIVKWRVDIELAAQALYEGIAAGDYGQPVARSDFDVYLRGGVLAYLKEDCDQRDVDGRFLLHIIPADPADLPAASREYGYASMNFRFADHGGRAGDICAASRELPGYAIDRIRTGQFVSGGGSLWDAEFPVAR